MPTTRPATTNAALLRRVRYFASLPAAELRRVAGRCATRTLRPGAGTEIRLGLTQA